MQNLNGPHITYDFGLISRQTLTVELDKLKESKETKFNDIVDFSTHERREWLIDFFNVNEKNSSLVAQLQT